MVDEAESPISDTGEDTFVLSTGQFGAPDPDALSPVQFEGIDHDEIDEQWDALTR